MKVKVFFNLINFKGCKRLNEFKERENKQENSNMQ